jgi:hypothetical protein
MSTFQSLPLETKNIVLRAGSVISTGQLGSQFGRATSFKFLLKTLLEPTAGDNPQLRHVARAVEVSHETVRRSFGEEVDDSQLSKVYPSNTTKESKLTPKQIADWIEFIDKEVPTKSGQNYRLQDGALQDIYARYKAKYTDVSI